MGLRKATTRGEENVINKGYQTPPKSKNKHEKHHQGARKKAIRMQRPGLQNQLWRRPTPIRQEETENHIANYFEDLYRAREGTAEYIEWNKQI